MARRRFTPEQRKAVIKAREKQRRACGRGNHWWYPDYSLKRRPIEPKYWTVEERFPVPICDGESIICIFCNIKGKMKNLTAKKQKKMQDIVDVFTENALGLQKDYCKP